MTLFLDFFWLVALVLGSPLIAWKLATVARWRVGLPERFAFRLPRPKTAKPLIWVHAVSVGEVLAARALVAEMGRRFPDHEVAISTITATGLDVARRHFPDHVCFFYPIDMTYAVRRVLHAMQPRLIVLVELELWPTFLTLASSDGIPIVVVNGRISERSARRYQLVRRLITRPITRFCVQNEEYAARFRSLGVPRERVLITGNLKYDTQALEGNGDGAAIAREIRAQLGISPDAPVIVGGSTHPSEESAVLAAYRALKAAHPGLRLVLAPRHTERIAAVVDEVARAGYRPLRKTEIDRRRSGTGTGTGTSDDVVIVDTLGELARIYRIADVVFVGGSLIPHGGQNMLEPAALGKAAVFGPFVKNFQAIADALLAENAARQIPGAEGLEAALAALLRDRAAAAALGERAMAFVEKHRGAAKRTVEVLAEVVGPRAPSPKPSEQTVRV